MRETDFLQLPPLKSSAILIGTGDRFILKLLYLCSYRYGMQLFVFEPNDANMVFLLPLLPRLPTARLFLDH